MTEEKAKLKDREFTDYRFKSKASRNLQKRMRRAAKRIKHPKSTAYWLYVLGLPTLAFLSICTSY